LNNQNAQPIKQFTNRAEQPRIKMDHSNELDPPTKQSTNQLAFQMNQDSRKQQHDMFLNRRSPEIQV
jgi:hypothetical protein